VIENRLYSKIEQAVIGNDVVYVKQQLPFRSDISIDLMRRHLAAEVEVIARLSGSGLLGGRLGLIEVVDYDIEGTRIVTKKIEGDSIEAALASGRWRRNPREFTRVFYLAGRWLKKFQMLPTSGIDFVAWPGSPSDLIEYCGIRLEILKSLGSEWARRFRSRILDWLELQVRRTPSEWTKSVLCHHDYAPFNIVWDGRTLTPIDFASCGLGSPLADLTYLIHRLQMMSIESPWKKWDVALWRRACLRGFGARNIERSPIFRALTVQHCLSRLKKYHERKPVGLIASIHNRWCCFSVKRTIHALVAQ